MEIFLKHIRSITTCTLLSLAMLSACSSKPAGQAATASPPPGTTAIQPVAPHEASSGQTAEGAVLETMDAANYTYVRVKTASGEIWAATSTFKVAVGDQVVVPLENPMEKFHSQTLKRDFPLIYFASHIAHAGEPASQTPARAPMSAGVAQVNEPVQSAPGGLTVANIIANRKTLAGKTVTVRGRVVKFNGGILGLNWIHIQDGSGLAKDGTNDITVTSTAGANASVGTVVTVTGSVVLDKDFGAGYVYAILIQGATITVK
jgi:hypothetical protein